MFPCPGIDSNEACCHVSPPDLHYTKSLCARVAGHDGPHRSDPFGFAWAAGQRRVIGTQHYRRESLAGALLAVQVSRDTGAD